MDMMNNLLLVDDNKLFADTFKEELASKGWKMIHVRSLDGLKKTLPGIHSKLSCVILDIKCLHTEDQEIENPDFIGDAITYLDQNFPGFPRVILTGDDMDYDGFKKYNKNEFVFLKTPEGKKELCVKVQYFVENSVRLRVKRENAEVFKVFNNNYLDFEKEEDLIELISASYNLKSINIKNYTGSIRKFLEAIFKKLNSINTSYLPDEFFTGDNANLDYCTRYLTGNHVKLHRDTRVFTPPRKFTPEHIGAMFWMIKSVTSSAGQHDYAPKVTVNAFLAVLSSLLEVLVWFNDFLEEEINS